MRIGDACEVHGGVVAGAGGRETEGGLGRSGRLGRRGEARETVKKVGGRLASPRRRPTGTRSVAVFGQVSPGGRGELVSIYGGGPRLAHSIALSDLPPTLHVVLSMPPTTSSTPPACHVPTQTGWNAPDDLEAVRFNSASDCQMTSSAVVSLPTLLTRSASPITPQNQLEAPPNKAVIFPGLALSFPRHSVSPSVPVSLLCRNCSPSDRLAPNVLRRPRASIERPLRSNTTHPTSPGALLVRPGRPRPST